MTSPYGPILTGVGFLQGGQLTQAARARYVAEVLGLLATGNHNGRGGTPTTQVFSGLVPLPPVAGPSIPNVTTLASEPLFWFDPDPTAALLAATLVDPAKAPIWNAVFPDLLLAKTAAALDANGSTPLFPIFDVSGPLGIDLPLPYTPPDLALKLNITPPELLAKLASLDLQLSLPSIPLPPIPPQLPNLLPPAIPGISLPGLPSLTLPDLLLGLIKLPFDLLLQLVLPPSLSLVLDLPGLPGIVLKLALDIVIKLLTDLGLLLVTPKLLIASILIYIKDIVAMVCTDIVGLLVGAGGTLTTTIAGLTGLV